MERRPSCGPADVERSETEPGERRGLARRAVPRRQRRPGYHGGPRTAAASAVRGARPQRPPRLPRVRGFDLRGVVALAVAERASANKESE